MSSPPRTKSEFEEMLSDPKALRMERIRGLDTIRAICALWVVIGHFGGPPLLAGMDDSSFVGRLLKAVHNNFYNGPAAVIVFFVISGFCIHFPQATNLTLKSYAAYFARRFIRIVIPMLAAIGVSKMIGVEIPVFHDSILWSLICEIVYYAIYPFLLLLRRQGMSWERMFLVALIASLCLPAFLGQNDFTQNGGLV